MKFEASEAMKEVIAEGVDQCNNESAMLAFYENQPDYWDDNPDGFLDDFMDSYAGTWDSWAQYAEQFFDDVYLHEVPEWLVNYIDYEAFGRDLSYDYWTADDGHYGVHVFRSN